MASAPVNVSTAGVNTVVAGQPGRRIRVLGYTLVASAAGTVQWQDGAGAALSGPMALAAGQALAAPDTSAVVGSERGWFLTGTSQSLSLNLGAGAAAAGHLLYDFS
jgi:hypothetical protein